jgi:hypothetical protein
VRSRVADRAGRSSPGTSRTLWARRAPEHDRIFTTARLVRTSRAERATTYSTYIRKETLRENNSHQDEERSEGGVLWAHQEKAIARLLSHTQVPENACGRSDVRPTSSEPTVRGGALQHEEKPSWEWPGSVIAWDGHVCAQRSRIEYTSIRFTEEERVHWSDSVNVGRSAQQASRCLP